VFLDDRTALNFRRMRREHERNVHRRQNRVRLRGLGRQHHRFERSRKRRLARDRAFAAQPLAIRMLGEVGHLQIERTRAHDFYSDRDVERFDERHQLVVRTACRCEPPALR